MNSRITVCAGSAEITQHSALSMLENELGEIGGKLSEIAQRCEAIANRALGEEPTREIPNAKEGQLYQGKLGELCELLYGIEDRIQEIDRAVTRLGRIA